MKNKNVYLVILMVAIVVILAAFIAAFFLTPKVPDKESPATPTPAPTVTPRIVALPTVTVTPPPTTLKVVVDPDGTVDKNNCTISAIVKGTENVINLTFNGVPWSGKKGVVGVSLPFGNIRRGDLVVFVEGDIVQKNVTFCSESSSSGGQSLSNTVSPTTATPPPEQIPEFPSLVIPVVSILILFLLLKK